MFNRYRGCCCQNNYNPEVIETLCNNVGTTAEYATAMSMNNGCGCDCGCMGVNTANAMAMNYDNCGCGFEEEPSVFPANPMLAQSYIPIQYMDKTFKPCVGLKMGTIFPELVSPYVPGQSMKEIDYLRKTNKIGKGCNECL